MQKTPLPLSLLCLLCSFLLLPVVKAGNTAARPHLDLSFAEADAASISNLLYDSLHLEGTGLSRDALRYACTGQQKLVKKGLVSNPDILTVCDFSQPSENKRLYIIDIRHYRLLVNTYVAHGRNSGLNYASRFSNKLKSLQSSLGFYITKGIYFGKHGLSLKLSGKEKGYNDNAEARAVVVHGAEYVGDDRTENYMGRSFGCPAVPQEMAAKVINIIKDGSCLFVYHPSKSYLHGSKLLNG